MADDRLHRKLNAIIALLVIAAGSAVGLSVRAGSEAIVVSVIVTGILAAVVVPYAFRSRRRDRQPEEMTRTE